MTTADRARARARRPDHGQAGKGLIGFLVALIVAGLVAYSAKQIFQVEHRYATLNDYGYELIKNADLRKMGSDDIKFEFIKKAREVGVPMDPAADANRVEVNTDSTGRRLRYTYDDPVVLPGYTYVWHRVIDHSWKKF